MPDNHTNKKKPVWGIILGTLAWLPHPNADAQSDSELLESVHACRLVPELSLRLACYDRALPPITVAGDRTQPLPEPAEPAEPVAMIPAPESPPTPAPAAVPSPSAPSVAEPREADPPTLVEIVTLESPSANTTRFHAADGRVFVRENASVLYRWPEAPFSVEVQAGRFGSTFLKFPDRNLRIRVAIRD